MKILFLKLLIILLFVSTNTFSQTSKTFFGSYYDLYSGKRVIVSDEYLEEQKFGFSSKADLSEIEITRSNNKEATKTTLITSLDDLKNDTLIFDVINKDEVRNSNMKLYLLNINNKKRYVLNYSIYSKSQFPFKVIQPIDIKNGYFCGEITEKNDEFTGAKKTSSHVGDDIRIIKNVEKNVTSYYLFLTKKETVLSQSKKGVIILLTNGDKLTYPEAEVSALNYSSSEYTYSSFVPITNQDFERLKKTPIKGVRLFIYDNMLSEFDGLRYMSLFNCF